MFFKKPDTVGFRIAKMMTDGPADWTREPIYMAVLYHHPCGITVQANGHWAGSSISVQGVPTTTREKRALWKGAAAVDQLERDRRRAEGLAKVLNCQ